MTTGVPRSPGRPPWPRTKKPHNIRGYGFLEIGPVPEGDQRMSDRLDETSSRAECLETFYRSFDRCLARPDFLESFYRRFIASSPEIARRFTHTDLARQARHLRASLHLVPVLGSQIAEADVHLHRIAERHAGDPVDAHPDHYALWLDTLVETVRDTDPDWTESVGHAWRAVMRPGIDFMLARRPPDAP